MKIKQINILSASLSETEIFYNQVLDIETYTRDDVSVSFMIGATQLTFQHSEEQACYHLAFDIPRNKLQEAFQWVEIRTTILPVTNESKYSRFELWNADSFYFYDNNGNLLELISRSDLPNQSMEAFSSAQILYVSEVGIVTPDAEALAKDLMAKYNIGVYSKQPMQKGFAALGDETGLLIIVSEGRNWFPTTNPALVYWFKAILENKGERFEIEC